MQPKIFEELSERERSFLENLSSFSKLKERERLNFEHKMTRKQKIQFIYENKVYLNNEDRIRMNQLIKNPRKVTRVYLQIYSLSFIFSAILNVRALHAKLKSR